MIFLFVLFGVVDLVIVISILLSGPRYKGPVSDHFDGSRFINPGGVRAQGLGAVLKWMSNRQRGPWTEVRTAAFHSSLPAHSDAIRITFVNHSSFILQFSGLNLLTDPVWSERTSPFSFAGPRRMRPPGVPFEQLPPIHYVALSHNHYDHLDLPTLKRLYAAHKCKFIVPLGVGALLKRANLPVESELDWWESRTLAADVSVQAVPAQHFSGRGGFDRDATLWCGYVFNTPRGKIYFAGDSGYNKPMFEEIGQRCGPMLTSLIPIGAYKPEWFMSTVHCSPKEAVQIHQDVRTKTSIATHFGTFPLADEGMEEPPRDLLLALAAAGISSESFIIPTEGKTVTVED